MEDCVFRLCSWGNATFHVTLEFKESRDYVIQLHSIGEKRERSEDRK